MNLFHMNSVQVRDAGSMEPPVSIADLRDEAVGETIDAIWRDADWIEAAVGYDGMTITPRLAALAQEAKIRLDRLPQRDDTLFQKLARELIACVSASVVSAAEREVDSRADNAEGEAR